MSKKEETKNTEGEINGGRNLCILGIAAVVIAFATTAVSLKIYHDTGDVYLDRSRPGYIEEEDGDEEPIEIDIFSDSGALDDVDIEWYINQVKRANDALTNSAGFPADAMSDEGLGLIENTSSDSVSATGENLANPGVGVPTSNHYD